MIGVAEISLSRSINGNPSLDTLNRIALSLNVEVQELFAAPEGKLYGLVQYEGETYKIDSVGALKSLMLIVQPKKE